MLLIMAFTLRHGGWKMCDVDTFVVGFVDKKTILWLLYLVNRSCGG